ncbi:MAG TPA: hypothetical protein DCX89_07210, partial [Saprospirales bacterium]|nr:hypothetical protein [Saprospirales bacterium]
TFIALLAVMFLFSRSMDVYGQTIQTRFGKNRVQYHDDFNNWWMYETDHFAVYWYGKGRNIVKAVIQLAELDHHEIQQFLGHTMNEKIRIIVYLDHSDYSQTNIAYLENELESGAGRAQFYDNKIVVFFNGDHTDLRKQIRSGIAKAYFYSMFQGVNITDLYNGVNNSDMPSWIITGLSDYLTDAWNVEFEEQLQFYFQNISRFKKGFKSLAKADPVTAGHSMWYFLEQNYGKQAVSDFLYDLRIQKSTKSAIEAVFDRSEREIYEDWRRFYKDYFHNQSIRPQNGSFGQVLMKKNCPITRILPDVEAGKLYYIENNVGRVKVKEFSLDASSKEKTLLKYGYKNEHQLTDQHYPLLAIDSSESSLGIIYEERDQLKLRVLHIATYEYIEHTFPESIQRIYAFSFYEPGILLMSASTDGFSDLYFYDLEGRQATRITNDYYNESGLVKIPGKDKNLFWVVSNHESDKFKAVEYDSFPPLSPYRLFAFDAEQEWSEALTTNKDHDILDVFFAGEKVIFRSKFSNMAVPELRPLQEGKPGSEGVFIDLPFRLITHGYRQQHYFYVYRNTQNQYLIEKILLDTVRFKTDKETLENNYAQPSISRKIDEERIDIQGLEISESLLFQTEFQDPPESDEISDEILGTDQVQLSGESGKDNIAVQLPVFNPVQAIAARLRFSFNEVVTRLDSEPIIDGLVLFDQLKRTYQPQVAGMLISTRVKDMLEDYVVEGGVRIAANFRGAEYFMHFHDLKKKTDWQYSLYRKSESRFEYLSQQAEEPDKLNYQTLLGRVKARYPFDIYRSIHASGMLRQDEIIVKSADFESLNIMSIPAQRLILELAYVFDNTSLKGINLWSGMRYKFFAAFSNRFEVHVEKPAVFRFSTGRMLMAGFDFRYYMELGKYSTLAFRGVGQTSTGSEKNIYFLGGVENSFFEKNSDAYPVPADEAFAFMTQVGNMRGFDRNARNGSSFLLLNVEYRMPVWRVFAENHLRHSFFRDMQFTCFLDLGTAWYGLTPFSPANSANSLIYEVPPTILFRIKQYNDPLIGALGLGFRTKILGYFMKLDYAWGIENLKFRTPKLHFSIGQDF